MLTSLYIQNLAVIEKVVISFSSGMNLFTGETGAGKSIVIDAINAVLGGRCSKRFVRSGEDKAVIIATFQNLPHDVEEKCERLGWDMSGDELIIQREINADGRTSARVNDMPVTVTSLRQIGQLLIHIHGQHDNQILLSPEQHIHILDRYGELEGLLKDYQYHFSALNKIEAELEKIRLDQAQKEDKLQQIHEQLQEIEQAELEIGEDAELEKDARVIKNSARIVENLELAQTNLLGDEQAQSALDQLSEAVDYLESASEYYGDISDVAQKLRGLYYEVQEVSRDVGDCLGNLHFDPNQLEAIECRLNEIFKLKRKYGPQISDILAAAAAFRQELETIELYDVRLNELMVGQRSEMKQVEQLADQLTERRRQTAEEFVRIVKSELEFLDMKGVEFHVAFTPCAMMNNGKEQVEFLISANVGEPPKSISKIASGGELSRIMLSMKNALADKDEIPTLIFDEIDTGVSGSAAQKIGLKLKQAAGSRQVVCVTHLAQIAALADQHFQIRKKAFGGRTFTQVKKLDMQGRIEEVARIMSAGEITDLTLQTAHEMIVNGSR